VSHANAALGTTIANYRVTGTLGEGGMGVVYRGEHVLLRRPAAIKVLQADLSRNPEMVRRFLNEARATTAIRHPGIVEIYDFGVSPDGSAYIVMELLDGHSLSDRIAQGPLSSTRAMQIARQIAGALAVAHDQGIVHRDLKPDNVFLVPDPEVPGGERIKLLDFGIAKLVDEPGGLNRTRTGVLMGTPTYMAPEQCRGVHVDHRADLYALGCILYECVTGRPPFRGEGVGDVLSMHMHEPPTPPRAFARVSPSLEAVILHLLAKSPDARPASASQVIHALDVDVPNTITGASTAIAVRRSPRVPPTWRRPALLFVGAVAISAGIAVTIGRVTSRSTASTTTTTTTTVASPAPDPTPVAVTAIDAAPAPAPIEVATVDARATTITATIDSVPSGAIVLANGVEQGRTPLRSELPAAPGPITFAIRLPGYEESQLRVPGDHAIDATVVLKKRRAAARVQPATPNPDRGVNPF
jgi:serine/threonine protein kinase